MEPHVQGYDVFVVYKMESFGDVKHRSSYDLEVLELQSNNREQNSHTETHTHTHVYICNWGGSFRLQAPGMANLVCHLVPNLLQKLVIGNDWFQPLLLAD
jgi:hypothetical protein